MPILTGMGRTDFDQYDRVYLSGQGPHVFDRILVKPPADECAVRSGPHWSKRTRPVPAGFGRRGRPGMCVEVERQVGTTGDRAERESFDPLRPFPSAVGLSVPSSPCPARSFLPVYRPSVIISLPPFSPGDIVGGVPDIAVVKPRVLW